MDKNAGTMKLLHWKLVTETDVWFANNKSRLRYVIHFSSNFWHILASFRGATFDLVLHTLSQIHVYVARNLSLYKVCLTQIYLIT